MKSQRYVRLRRCSILLALAFLAFHITGCGLVKKQRPDFVGNSAAADDSQVTPAPVVLASAVLEEQSEGPAQEGDDAGRDATVSPPAGVRPVGAGESERSQVPSQLHESASEAAINVAAGPAAPAMRTVEHANARNFQQVVLESDETVLVDFSADWCHYCKKAEPILKQFATNSPNVKVVEVDFDKNRGLARSYGVKSLPTMVVFRGGQPVSRHTGKVNEALLKKLVIR